MPAKIPISLKVWGDYACFTVPESRVERISYPVMTPSAARGIVEAVFWKPQITYRIDRILVLNPIRFTTIRRNEIQGTIPVKGTQGINAWRKDPSSYRPYLVDSAGRKDVQGENRTQRTTTLLKDVAYVIEAEMTVKNPNTEDNPTKYREMFERRARNGQCVRQPSFGIREFAAFFGLPDRSEEPASESRDLGIMLYDLDFPGDGPPGARPPSSALFAPARLENGVLDVNRTPDTNYLFWSTRQEPEANPGKAIEQGSFNLSFQPEDVRKTTSDSDSSLAARGVYSSIHSGNPEASKSSDLADRYFCLALSGSSARGIIRSWIDLPLREAVTHVKEWFEDLAIPLDRRIYEAKAKDAKREDRRCLAEQGDIFGNWPLWRLTESLRGKGDSGSDELVRLRTQLWTCALKGRSHPVPTDILITACSRIGTSGECNPEHAALIQLILSRKSSQSNQPKMNMNDETSPLHTQRS